MKITERTLEFVILLCVAMLGLRCQSTGRSEMPDQPTQRAIRGIDGLPNFSADFQVEYERFEGGPITYAWRRSHGTYRWDYLTNGEASETGLFFVGESRRGVTSEAGRDTLSGVGCAWNRVNGSDQARVSCTEDSLNTSLSILAELSSLPFDPDGRSGTVSGQAVTCYQVVGGEFDLSNVCLRDSDQIPVTIRLASLSHPENSLDLRASSSSATTTALVLPVELPPSTGQLIRRSEATVSIAALQLP